MMNMTKRNPKKLISKILSIAFAGVVLCAGVFPFLPMQEDKASAEGVLESTDKDAPFPNAYHNPFAGARFSRAIVNPSTSNYNEQIMAVNTMPDTVSVFRDSSSSLNPSDYNDFRRYSYPIPNYQEGTTGNSYAFVDGIEASGNNYNYVSYFPTQAKVKLNTGDCLFRFTFEDCLVEKIELDNLLFNFRFLYSSLDYPGNWIENPNGYVRLKVDYFDYSLCLDYSGWVSGSSRSTFSRTSQGYCYPFLDFEYPLETVHNETSYVGWTDSRDLVLCSGQVSAYVLYDGWYSPVNSGVYIPIFSYSLWSGNTEWQSYYNKYVFGRYNTLNKDYLDLRASFNPTKAIFSTAQNFFELEIFPNFRISYFLMIGVGAMIFGFVLKVFMGG